MSHSNARDIGVAGPWVKPAQVEGFDIMVLLPWPTPMVALINLFLLDLAGLPPSVLFAFDNLVPSHRIQHEENPRR